MNKAPRTTYQVSRRGRKARKRAFMSNLERKNRINPGPDSGPSIPSCLNAFESHYGYSSTRKANKALWNRDIKAKKYDKDFYYGKTKAKGGKVSNLTEYAEFIPACSGKRDNTLNDEFYRDSTRRYVKGRVKKIFSKT